MSLLALPSSFGGRIESESVVDFIGIRNRNAYGDKGSRCPKQAAHTHRRRGPPGRRDQR